MTTSTYEYEYEGKTYTFSGVKIRETSEWQCYMFGSTPAKPSMCYRPEKGAHPNWFQRWMMKVFFGCTWVKDKNLNR